MSPLLKMGRNPAITAPASEAIMARVLLPSGRMKVFGYFPDKPAAQAAFAAWLLLPEAERTLAAPKNPRKGHLKREFQRFSTKVHRIGRPSGGEYFLCSIVDAVSRGTRVYWTRCPTKADAEALREDWKRLTQAEQLAWWESPRVKFDRINKREKKPRAPRKPRAPKPRKVRVDRAKICRKVRGEIVQWEARAVIVGEKNPVWLGRHASEAAARDTVAKYLAQPKGERKRPDLLKVRRETRGRLTRIRPAKKVGGGHSWQVIGREAIGEDGKAPKTLAVGTYHSKEAAEAASARFIETGHRDPYRRAPAAARPPQQPRKAAMSDQERAKRKESRRRVLKAAAQRETVVRALPNQRAVQSYEERMAFFRASANRTQYA